MRRTRRPAKLKPRRRLRGIRASHIPRRRRLDPKPEAVLGSRRSSISRGVPARRSKAASTRRRASVRKPTKAGRAGLGARGRLAPVAASYEAALYEAGADKGQYDETPHRRPRNAALRDQRSGSSRAPRRERAMRPVASTVFARASKGLTLALGDRLRIRARAVRRDSRERAAARARAGGNARRLVGR